MSRALHKFLHTVIAKGYLILAIALRRKAGEAVNKVAWDTVGIAIRINSTGEAIVGGGRIQEGSYSVDRRYRRGSCTGSSPLLDQGTPPLRNLIYKSVLQILYILQLTRHRLAIHQGVQKIGDHGGAVIAPHGHSADRIVEFAQPQSCRN